jgi:hypothetical protein
MATNSPDPFIPERTKPDMTHLRSSIARHHRSLSPAMTMALAVAAHRARRTAIIARHTAPDAAGGWAADGEWYPSATDPYALHAAMVDRAALLSGRPW